MVGTEKSPFNVSHSSSRTPKHNAPDGRSVPIQLARDPPACLEDLRQFVRVVVLGAHRNAVPFDLPVPVHDWVGAAHGNSAVPDEGVQRRVVIAERCSSARKTATGCCSNHFIRWRRPTDGSALQLMRRRTARPVHAARRSALGPCRRRVPSRACPPLPTYWPRPWTTPGEFVGQRLRQVVAGRNFAVASM